MSETIYDSDFTKYLPQPLTNDPKMVALAKAAADELLTASGLIENVLIYSRIDELPEELVDILAYDLHVDWYDFSYPLAAKRDLLKSSVQVHKKMGTKYAIEKALSALYPESEVEEWFEYEGEPGHFHIVCDVTTSRITASYSDIVRAVKLYKRLSAHMDEVAYQSHICCKIHTHTDFFLYRVPCTGRIMAGTYPQRNRRGIAYRRNIVVGTEAAGFIFINPAAGTIPERNTIFHGRTVQIDAETALNAFRHRNTPAGQINAGEEPQRSHRGAQAGTVIEARTETEEKPFSVPTAGTVPDRDIIFQENGADIEAEGEAEGFPFCMQAAGTKPERNIVMNNSEAGIAAEEAADGFLYTVKAAGTVPERNTGVGAGSGGIESTVKAEVFKHTNKPCGSRRKL